MGIFCNAILALVFHSKGWLKTLKTSLVEQSVVFFEYMDIFMYRVFLDMFKAMLVSKFGGINTLHQFNDPPFRLILDNLFRLIEFFMSKTKREKNEQKEEDLHGKAK